MFGMRVSLTFLLQVLFPIALTLTPHPCYYGANKLASDDLIPCYPSIFSDHYSCCRVGDKCLEHGACYDNFDTGVTYQYGCTDSTFQDSHCPQKCNLDTKKSQWVGLVFCNGTNGLPDDTWVCHHPDNCGKANCNIKQPWKDTIEKLNNTGCEDIRHDDKYVAIEASGTLSDIAALPSSSRLESWWAEHTGRVKASTTSTGLTTLTTPGGNTVSKLATPTATSSTPPSSLPTSSNTNTSTIGLGVGIGLGIPILLSIIGLTFFFYKRHQRKSHDTATLPSTSTSPPDPPEKKDQAAAASYYHKAELDGTPVLENQASPQPSEMQGSSVAGTPWVSPEMGQQEGFGKERGARVHEMPG